VAALGSCDGAAAVVSGGGCAAVTSGEDAGGSGTDRDGSGSVRGGSGTDAGGALAIVTGGSDEGALSSRMTSAVAIISAPAIPTPVTILVIRGIGRP